MNKNYLLTLMIVTFFIGAQAQNYEVHSPDRNLKIEVQTKDEVTYAVYYADEYILKDCPVGMKLRDAGLLGKQPEIENYQLNKIDETIEPPVPHKRAQIRNQGNELVLHFKNNYGLIFRAYNDGVAYRFFTEFESEEIVVEDEEVAYKFVKDDTVFFPEEKSFITHSERHYKHLALAGIPDTSMASLPLFVKRESGPNVLITEADLLDYPGLYLKGSGNANPALKSLFPHYSLKEKLQGDRTLTVTKRADYIAKTAGKRKFPWRVAVIGQNDGVFINTDMVYRLASPNRLDETAWIKPGKVAWDWWNALNIYGVDFKSGINTRTYKYYIDFAAEYNIPYIIMDEGWSDTKDLLDVKASLDMEELMAYAEKKNVGIILWVISATLDRQMDQALKQFEEWGVKGIKVDFMQRDDQKMVNFYERTARKAAEHHLVVNFHGSYKPSGLRRTYPNVLTREGLLGLEQSKWSDVVNPEHDVHLPFIRMVAGPMDFTPGAMRNAHPENFKPRFNRPMSLGTRCHQLAMYVVYESPLQMLSDSPSNYYREPETMRFLEKVPAVWDETLPLKCKAAEYVSVARRRGDAWYVGGLTDWSSRTMTFDLDFLEENTSYKAVIYRDGPNANSFAEDFVREEKQVTRNEQLKVHLAKGGGFAIRIVKE